MDGVDSVDTPGGGEGMEGVEVNASIRSATSTRIKLTACIAVLNIVVIGESACMLSQTTNPFFDKMDRPTPAFIGFMILQMVYAATAALLSLGTCAKKIEWVRWNRVLYVVVAINNVLYTVPFFLKQQWVEGAVFVCIAVLAVFGILCCQQFTKLFADHHLVPTTSPSFVRHKVLV